MKCEYCPIEVTDQCGTVHDLPPWADEGDIPFAICYGCENKLEAAADAAHEQECRAAHERSLSEP